MTVREQHPLGLRFHGELEVASANALVLVPLFDDDLAAVDFRSGNRLALTLAQLDTIDPGEIALFFDDQWVSAEISIAAAVDGGTIEDQLKVTGNRTDDFPVGTSIEVNDSTANDGRYTVARQTWYDYSNNQTIIYLPTASLTDEAADGNISTTPIQAFIDGAAGEDTLTVLGDRTSEFRTGRVFTVEDDSAVGGDNDGDYTSTGAAYSASTGLTTINVATASFTAAVPTSGHIVAKTVLETAARHIMHGTDWADALPAIATWPPQAMRVGPIGHKAYINTSTAVAAHVLLDGFIQHPLVKTDPRGEGPQSR